MVLPWLAKHIVAGGDTSNSVNVPKFNNSCRLAKDHEYAPGTVKQRESFKEIGHQLLHFSCCYLPALDHAKNRPIDAVEFCVEYLLIKSLVGND